MQKNSLHITVVGLDGSGKSAVIERLSQLDVRNQRSAVSGSWTFDECSSHEQMDTLTRPTDVVLQVVDALRLRECLQMTPSFMEHGHPMVIAINRYDLLLNMGHRLDLQAFREQTGVPVVLVSTVTGDGLLELAQTIRRAAIDPTMQARERFIVHGWEQTDAEAWHAYQDAYTFKLDTIGSLKNFINDNNALNIRKLTLKGVMDETEFELIQKCKYLTYLDMSQCFTFASVAVAKNKAKAELAFAQLVALASGWDRQQKKLQFANHETTAEQLQQAQLRDYFIQNSGIQDISVEDVDAIFGQGKVFPSSECYFPEYALVGLFNLEEIKFPNKLLKLELNQLWDKSKFYTKLRKVTSSNELKYLGHQLFDGASELQEVNFPDSLQYIGQLCFSKCNLKKIDLSRTKITQCDDHMYKNDSNLLVINAFYENPLEEFRSPKNFVYREKWYEGKSGWFNTKADEVIIYMNTPEPFCNAEVLQGIIGKIKEIHIPRGMKAAWRGYPNLIDDIDL